MTRSLRTRLLLPLALALVSVAAQAQSTAAATPPMGWNSWNHFAAKVTDADVRAAADQMVATGMRDAGYVYVNLDDTWQGRRDASGVLRPNERFPDMKALAEYVHRKGLKFGIYSSPGAKTCGGYEGSLGHEAQDATMYAAWGVDFLKYDLCSFAGQMDAARKAHPDDPEGAASRVMIDAFRTMGDALKATGRPIVYSLCQYGLFEPWKWGPSVGASMWRTTDDINDTYARMAIIAQSQANLAKYAGPGHWNDPDMLEVGNGGMNEEEYRTHMTFWALLAAPLLAGNDLSTMNDSTRRILMNREVIAIDQDPLGKQAERISQIGDYSVWARPLKDGRIAVGVFNGSRDGRTTGFDLRQLGRLDGAKLYDVWAGKDLGHQRGVYARRLPVNGCMLLIVSK